MNFYQGLYASFTIFMIVSFILTFIAKNIQDQKTVKILNIIGNILYVFGFIAFILNFIPTIGTIIAVLIPTVFAIIQLTDLSSILYLFIFLVLIQFVIGNVIYPKLMGKSLNISQFVVILSLVVWGAMWGTIGMFLAVPIMMILLIILSQFESTKNLAVLISEDGNILRNNDN